jgi:hypothetical protein
LSLLMFYITQKDIQGLTLSKSRGLYQLISGAAVSEGPL